MFGLLSAEDVYVFEYRSLHNTITNMVDHDASVEMHLCLCKHSIHVDPRCVCLHVSPSHVYPRLEHDREAIRGFVQPV